MATSNTCPPPTPNRTDPIAIAISIFTGFVDGSFQAKNVSACRKNMLLEANILRMLSDEIRDEDENRTVYLLTRLLKHLHPSMFHCYYSGKETVATFNKYMEINSA
jgi:hypothetical protein